MEQPRDNPLIDFAIITVIKTERDAVCRAFRLTDRNRVRREAQQYWRGRLELQGGSFYEIVVAQSLDMAGIDAAIVTMRTVYDWDPGALLLVGFAGAAHDGSEPDHERLGDLIIGSDVYYYERGKATDNGVIPEPYMHKPSANLFHIASTLPEWTSRILAQRPGKTGGRPKVIPGVMACGEKVIAGEAVRNQIRNGQRKIRAIEMEGFAFSQAAWANLNKPHLILKAICDRADRDKADDWQPYAAAVAAGFAKFFLLNEPVKPLNPAETNGEPRSQAATVDQNSSKKQANNWEIHLPKINFRTVFSIVDEVFAKIQAGGAALFLLQNSYIRGGEWCVAHIKDLLSKDSARFQAYEIGFVKHQRVSQLELMNRLGQYLGIAQPNDPQVYPDLIIDRLCGSLQPGSTVFIELKLWNDLSEQRNFLPWLVSELWRPMVRAINNATDHISSARLVFVISAKGVLDPLSLDPSLECSRAHFDEEKILELRLSKWRRDEIRNWLIRFLPATLSNEEYSLLASSIYQSSDEGLPLAVYSSLLDCFAPNMMGNLPLQEDYA